MGLSSADQRSIADTARQYCLGSAPDSPTRSLTSDEGDDEQPSMRGPRVRARPPHHERDHGASIARIR